MNYLEQIKGFWIAQEAHQLGTREIAMYFYLLEVCNRVGWMEEFNRNNYKMMADLTIKSYKTLTTVRDNLSNAQVLVFVQKNGDANAGYSLIDLGKKYLGNGGKQEKKEGELGKKYQGLGEGSYQGLGKGVGKKYQGLGEVNIYQTFKNQTKPESSKSHSGDGAPAKKKNELPLWKKFIEAWDSWYQEKFETAYRYLKKDFAHLKQIYQFLQKRAGEKQAAFTEEYLLAAFRWFLDRAWEKDDWLKKNFSITNVLSQFNQIANAKHATEKSGNSNRDQQNDQLDDIYARATAAVANG